LEDNIKMNLGEPECHDVDCILLTQKRGQWQALVNMVTNFRVP